MSNSLNGLCNKRKEKNSKSDASPNTSRIWSNHRLLHSIGWSFCGNDAINELMDFSFQQIH